MNQGNDSEPCPPVATRMGEPYDLYVYTVWSVELEDDGETYHTDELVEEGHDRGQAERAAVLRAVRTGRPHMVTERAFSREEENDVLRTWRRADADAAATEAGFEAGYEHGRSSLREAMQQILDSEHLDGPEVVEALQAVIGDENDAKGEAAKQVEVALNGWPKPDSLVAQAVAQGGLRFKVLVNDEFHGSNAERIDAIVVAEGLVAKSAEQVVTVVDSETGRTVYSRSRDPNPDMPPYRIFVNGELHRALTGEYDAIEEAERLLRDCPEGETREIEVRELPPGERIVWRRRTAGE